MNSIFLNAIKSSTKVRNRLGLNLFEPLNIYDTCTENGVTVRIVNINMEGIYVKADKQNRPTILLSNDRPITRRVFTCAHEYGHHFFGHGSKIDTLDYTSKYTSVQDQEELLVNAFAGSLLMPIAGVQSEFIKRKWNPNTSSPINFYTISSYFGVGYQTLIYHCKVNKIISYNKMQSLLKYTPAKIFKEVFSSDYENSHFKHFDNFSQPTIVDIEVSNYLILPHEALVNSDYLIAIKKTTCGTIYSANKVGVSEVASSNFSKNITIRIESKNYVGLSEYRHLE